MKVYVADRSYDDCRPTCSRRVGRQRRSLPDEANGPFDIAWKKKAWKRATGWTGNGNGCLVNVLRPILRRRCETWLVNFGFGMSFVFSLTRSINIIDL